MALAWVHQTRLDAVPRKVTRNNLAPKSWGRREGGGRRTSLGALPAYANHQRTGGPKSPGISCAVLLHAGNLGKPHPRAREAEHRQFPRRCGRLESRNIDSADLRGRPTCLQPVRKNVLEWLRDRLTGYRFS